MDYDDDMEVLVIESEDQFFEWLEQQPRDKQKFFAMQYYMDCIQDAFEMDTTGLLDLMYMYMDMLHRVRNVELGSSPH